MDNYIKIEAKDAYSPGINYIGRFDFSEIEGPKFAWSASTISARFYGTTVSAKLKSYGDNYFTVLIDDKVTIPSLGINDEAIVTLAENLQEGIHKVSLVKKTEYQIGTSQFLGFNFGNGALLPPEPYHERKIEIIGDSISCGFGNEGEHQDIEYNPKYDNAYLAYGSVAARELEAEHMIIGCSGLGVYRKYDGDLSCPMPDRYPLTIQEKADQWNFNNWVPQVVVINLGTNDFSFGFIADRETFVSEYIKLIDKIHTNYPDAKIICTLGSIMEGEELKIAREYIKDDIVGTLKEKGSDWIYFFEFCHQQAENGYGISWHPSLKTHELMGKQLAEYIRVITGWV